MHIGYEVLFIFVLIEADNIMKFGLICDSGRRHTWYRAEYEHDLLKDNVLFQSNMGICFCGKLHQLICDSSGNISDNNNNNDDIIFDGISELALMPIYMNTYSS